MYSTTWPASGLTGWWKSGLADCLMVRPGGAVHSHQHGLQFDNDQGADRLKAFLRRYLYSRSGQAVLSSASPDRSKGRDKGRGLETAKAKRLLGQAAKHGRKHQAAGRTERKLILLSVCKERKGRWGGVDAGVGAQLHKLQLAQPALPMLLPFCSDFFFGSYLFFFFVFVLRVLASFDWLFGIWLPRSFYFVFFMLAARPCSFLFPLTPFPLFLLALRAKLRLSLRSVVASRHRQVLPPPTPLLLLAC